MVALVKDKRGTIVVQTVLILPILALVVFGSFEVWKVMSVKQSLTSGTSEAARYLSFNPGDKNGAEEDIVYEELANNDLIGDTSLDLDISYYPDRLIENLPCDAEFSVEVKLTLPWEIAIPGLSPITDLSMTTEQVGQIFCTE